MSDTPEMLDTPQEAQDRQAFLALLWAASHPGRWHSLPASAPPFLALGQALLDLETSFYSPNEALAHDLARSGARHLPAQQAAYLFLPAFSAVHLPAVEQAARGTLLYPDSAATLFIGLPAPEDHDEALRLTFSGPGIDGQIAVELWGIPAALWTLRAQVRYPLGWDIFFIEPERGQVLGLPRSTQIIQEG